jgi:hypothetical protein
MIVFKTERGKIEIEWTHGSSTVMPTDSAAKLARDIIAALGNDVDADADTLQTLQERYTARAQGPDAVAITVGGTEWLASRAAATLLFASLGKLLGASLPEITADRDMVRRQLAACDAIARSQPIEGADMPPNCEAMGAVLKLQRDNESKTERLKQIHDLLHRVPTLLAPTVLDHPSPLILSAVAMLHKAYHLAAGEKCACETVLGELRAGKRKDPLRADANPPPTSDERAAANVIATLLAEALFGSKPPKGEG